MLLKLIKQKTYKINQKSKNKDEAITFIFADHGWFFDKNTKKKVKDQYNLNELEFRLPVYFAYKIPDHCKNLQVPKSSINLMRFALNCAEDLDIEFLENKSEKYICLQHQTI